MRLKPVVIILLLFTTTVLISQENSPAGDILGEGTDFGLGLGLSILSLDNSITGEEEIWNNLKIRPDFSVGTFGIGLDIEINFSIENADGTTGFRIREEDWLPDPDNGRSFLDIYLPIIRYIHLGYKGDPFYLAAGSISNFKLGNGFIVSDYSNTSFLPDRRITGLSFDLDGKLFDFPYIGLETIIGNLAAFDVIGGRFFIRPLYWLDVPTIKDIQLGFTAVIDTDPFSYERESEGSAYSDYFENGESVFIFGGDIRFPLFSENLVRLAIFGDLVVQNSNLGGMVGLGGELFDIMTYGAQVRFLGNNFIPEYFNSSYDLYRAQRWEIYKDGNATVSIPDSIGWLAKLGVDILDSQIVLDATLEGSFTDNSDIDHLNPTLTANFSIDPELLGGITIGASYRKQYIRDIADLISPENAIITAKIGYATGGVAVGFIYDLRYDSTPGDKIDADGNPRYWTVSTRLETSFSLF
ncbi:MAG: hypothetical protein ACR2PY_00465 [Salinispira sp.]